MKYKGAAPEAINHRSIIAALKRLGGYGTARSISTELRGDDAWARVVAGHLIQMKKERKVKYTGAGPGYVACWYLEAQLEKS